MDLTSAFPYWTVRNGMLAAFPAIERDLACDAVVIGGGISGALLAYRLISKGVGAVVIDRRDVGHGSTSASTGLLQYEVDTPLHRLQKMVKPACAERAYRSGIEAIQRLKVLAGKNCGFALRPSIQFATNQKELAGLREEFALRKTLAFPVSFLGARELRGYGIVAKGGIRSEIGAEVDPYRLAHRLFRMASARGLRVFDQTAVTHYTQKARGVEVHTNRGPRIRAKAVFFATGYETNDILPAGLIQLKSTYALVTEPVRERDFWRERALLWGAGDPYLYARTTDDGRVFVGGADDGVLNPGRRDRQVNRKARELERQFRRVCPRFRAETAFGWAGTFGGTKDGLAYIGPHPAFPHGYFALGFGGNGITFGETAARILTDLFLGKKNRDAEVFSFAR